MRDHCDMVPIASQSLLNFLKAHRLFGMFIYFIFKCIILPPPNPPCTRQAASSPFFPLLFPLFLFLCPLPVFFFSLRPSLLRDLPPYFPLLPYPRQPGTIAWPARTPATLPSAWLRHWEYLWHYFPSPPFSFSSPFFSFIFISFLLSSPFFACLASPVNAPCLPSPTPTAPVTLLGMFLTYESESETHHSKHQ